MTDTTHAALLDARWQSFYRAYPWLKYRLETLDALLHPGTKAAPCSSVTLDGTDLRDARSLLSDLQQHLARGYDPQQHQAFRLGQARGRVEKEGPPA